VESDRKAGRVGIGRRTEGRRDTMASLGSLPHATIMPPGKRRAGRLEPGNI